MWLQVRAVVFRMNDNHLLVYNPVAPTEEFLQQLDALQVPQELCGFSVGSGLD